MSEDFKTKPKKDKKEMYNPDMKQKFIDKVYAGRDSTAAIARNVLKSLGEYERNWGADFCTRSPEEISPVLDNVLGMRVSSKWSSVNILKEYIRWCIMNGYPGATDSLKKINIDISGYEKVKMQTVANPIQLQKYFDDIFSPESDETMDIVYRCYLWMAYMGIPEEEALNIKSGNVDFALMRIKYGDKEAPIYRESLASFRSASDLTSFKYVHTRYTTVRDRVLGDMLLRGVKENVHKYTIRQVTSRKFSEEENIKKTGKKLSFYRIWISGLFYRMYEQERAGGDVDFTDIAKEEVSKIRLDPSGNPAPYIYNHDKDGEQQRIYRKTRDYNEDYNRWKFVFGI